MKNLAKLQVNVRISISNPNSTSGSVFGPGIAKLCLGVRETGSLNAAAKSMGMAYSKAWRIIKETEEALDLQLLDRNGAHGSSLTEDGSKLIDGYITLTKHLENKAEKDFLSFM